MLIKQDKTGTVAGANAYIDRTEMRQYFTDIGVDLSTYTDDEVDGAIVEGTRFLDNKFEFLGYKLTGDSQTTEFPRYKTTAPDPLEADIPQKIKDASAELALYTLTGGILATTVSPEDVGISMERNKVGEIEEEKEYQGSKSESGVAVVTMAELLLTKSGWLKIAVSVVTRS